MSRSRAGARVPVRTDGARLVVQARPGGYLVLSELPVLALVPGSPGEDG